MHVESERFDDSSSPDEDGYYEYRYTGVSYRFRDDKQELVFRAYDEEPTLATLVAPIVWTSEIVDGDLFRSALGYLRERTSIASVRLYNRWSGAFTDVLTATEPKGKIGEPAP